MSILSLPRGPLMLDIQGTELQAHERELLCHPQVGGVILFRRNFVSPAQIRDLVAEIHAVRSPALLVAVDHEGGRVQRFLSGFTHLPPMRVLGQLWQQTPEQALVLAEQCGEVLATELRAVGVDLSFTPVLDLDWGRSGVIGDRSFALQASTVTVLAQALIRGLARGGMAACGKHFPGHGWVEADSHHAIPVDERDFATIAAADLQPFSALAQQGLAAVMPAHVVYPAVDDQPAGFSAFWLQHILRQQLRFEGVIFSDDLCMEGAAGAGGVVERAALALQAGCDMVLVCNRPDLAQTLLNAWGEQRAIPSSLAPRLAAMAGQLSIEAAQQRLTEADFIAMQTTVAALAIPPEQLRSGVKVGEAH